ncbi:TetR/AcrR family transcriptional regulator [Segetibacter sp. 3557_3]|uniref:TetR/AcrR family transcriptional regulator n=1 Tax=Segetibacter sp. 3557_3 TaxID=2547429 RepID=UPI001058963A|nr:TetR/AcrR family transcriptional regulator [Segetibacter sp. 3557_3]TDH24558.1 TetR/AcrR family transcriptional regulator [Segetibacter sp. 3557_3]
MTNTRGKILDKALEMFNERGIEYVGLRELAAVLGIRVGNITYYFATKDDLVFELSQQLSKANAEIIFVDENITMTGFLEMLNRVYLNQVKFRCLLLSFVHVMEQNKLVAAAYKTTQRNRNATISANIGKLAASGYLDLKNDEEQDFLVSTLALVSRFWISEAAISFAHLSSQEQIRHYLRLAGNLLIPYATAKAKRQIRDFLSTGQLASIS